MAAASSPALGADYYDEIHDSEGNLRPAYSDIYPNHQSISPEENQRFLADSRAALDGDISLDRLPRILSKEEYEEIRRGVEQRGKALHLFLVDYFSGQDQKYSKVIPKKALERIVERYGETGYVGLMNPDHIAFTYGPDIIRDADGLLREVEGNVGFVGGPGNLRRSWEVLFDRAPEYRGLLLAADHPKRFGQDLMEYYRRQRIPPDGKVVVYAVPPYPDNEVQRYNEILRSEGAEIVTPDSRKKLVVTQEGVFLTDPYEFPRRQEPVGFLILQGEHDWFDTSHPVTSRQSRLSAAKHLLLDPKLSLEERKRIEAAILPGPDGRINDEAVKSLVRRHNAEVPWAQKLKEPAGLVEAILSGKVATNYTPGLNFIGDKEFYLYVEDLVREYLGEEPLIKSIPTQRLGKVLSNGFVQLNQKLLNRVFQNQNDYVIKRVDGRAGDAVWVGPFTPKVEFQALRSQIAAAPDRFIVQKFIHLSVWDGKLVDLRLVSAVSRAGVLASRIAWGRDIPLGGNGKVNSVTDGREHVVLVLDTKQDCEKAFWD